MSGIWKNKKEQAKNNELLDGALIVSKPDKENYKNGAFHFPAYIDGGITINLNEPEIHRIELIKRIPYAKPVSNIYKIIVERVEEDSRTTCMIKNIPNKYTSKMLLDFINETHFGEYDFFYLRIDFKNRCNVGYAFINFLNRDALLRFHKRINGKKWPAFISGKIAELTYASIQGIKKLKQKFKKSAVMQEDEEFRPKLFYTEGPNKGIEKSIFE